MNTEFVFTPEATADTASGRSQAYVGASEPRGAEAGAASAVWFASIDNAIAYSWSGLWHVVDTRSGADARAERIERVASTEPIRIQIRDQVFTLNVEDGTAILSHPRWSLVGVGEDLSGAATDLLVEARDMLEIFGDQPPEELSESTQQMLGFVRDLLAFGA